ncbi:MAG: hypothetical protein JNN06_07560, partial [Gemmobacter sp.]|uniref:hypothetical protein n=1 Tax=Gemmobacter sp. TaxID=1898957 RepID=UPI001A3CB6CC
MRALPLTLLLGLVPAASLAQQPEMMTQCEPGAAVMVPGFLSAGVITEEKSGMCLIDMGAGNITAMPPGVLARAAKPEGATTATEGPEALIEGYWTCAFAAGGESFELYLAPGRYDTMEGSTGELLPYEADPLAVRFVGGPYDGLFGTVSNAALSFQPPGASGSAHCTFR